MSVFLLSLTADELRDVAQTRLHRVEELVQELDDAEAVRKALEAQVVEKDAVIANHQAIIASLLGGPERTPATVDVEPGTRKTPEQLLHDQVQRQADSVFLNKRWEAAMQPCRDLQERCIAEDA